VIQLAPPLIADSEQFEEIHDVLRSVLTEAGERVSGDQRSHRGDRLRRR
jgi:adenosylmethionine-8-amino-7-oxononanoate aminotransferase